MTSSIEGWQRLAGDELHLQYYLQLSPKGSHSMLVLEEEIETRKWGHQIWFMYRSLDGQIIEGNGLIGGGGDRVVYIYNSNYADMTHYTFFNGGVNYIVMVEN
ncbi:hypothetical protein P691DRAFT_788676 [Macrolepiota fuliginosa MF-IS2]|uniref:Uncharacterized protein n=1 Tax=Macrolepiota fuliginosa MF-IS2 TaxID=1400762 RepID=A0A9P5X284_9AGAR|nr:hypothetical protein P691DRAFT_788676 [Macrolepiota fuliginosa MF-IS2]